MEKKREETDAKEKTGNKRQAFLRSWLAAKLVS